MSLIFLKSYYSFICWSQICSFVRWLKHSSNSVCPKWTHVPLKFVNPQFSFTLVNYIIITTASSLKQSSYLKFLLFSLLRYLIHTLLIGSTSKYASSLTSLHLYYLLLKILRWFAIVLRIKFILFKMASKTIIFSYTMSPLVLWTSLYLSNMSSFCSPLGLWHVALSSWFSFPAFCMAGSASSLRSSIECHILRDAFSDRPISDGPSYLVLTISWEYFRLSV